VHKILIFLYAYFITEGVVPDISEDSFDDINVICGLVKSYFRSLPIPVITFDLYDQFIAAVSKLNVFAIFIAPSWLWGFIFYLFRIA